MNLSPEWVPLLKSSGFDACHWSDIGAPNALDVEIIVRLNISAYQTAGHRFRPWRSLVLSQGYKFYEFDSNSGEWLFDENWVPPDALPAGKSKLSQSKPDLLFDDLRKGSPPSWVFQSVPHRGGGEKAAHFLQKIFP